MADRVVVMDKGEIISAATPWKTGDFLGGDNKEDRHPMFYGLPSVMKIFSACGGSKMDRGLYRREDGKKLSPLTIRDGRLWLESVLDIPKNEEQFYNRKEVASEKIDNPIIEIKDLWYQYEKNAQPVLRGLNLKVKPGELFCLMGGNGAGKSTTLKAVAGILKAQRGTITVDGLKVCKENNKEITGKILAMVPQNPQALFTEITVEEELAEALYFKKLGAEEKAARVGKMMDTMEISHLRKSHPYDLSGGEQQRLALGKILLLEPKIVLLDEPTKGLDPFFKITLAGIFEKLKAEGVTLFMVSHDVEFCAEYGDRCAMFFDGDVVSCGEAKPFFAGNSFYTTTANRIARQWNSDLVTWEEVATWVEQNTTL